jgi:hypothetical protein
MKTHLNIISTLCVLITAVSLLSCKSKKVTPSIDKQTGAIEISVPFNSKDYQSDKDNFRAKSSGNSMDLTTSKKIALQNAKSEMAGLIQTTVKKVTEQYTNQRQVSNVQEFSNKFEEMAREVTHQDLVDVRVIGEKIFQEPNKNYTYWVAIEANKQNILNGIDKGISKNAKLAQDYDRKKFEEIFNQEMDKLAKERGQ